MSQSCINYIQQTGAATNTTVYDQRIVEGSVQGSLFKLPAGDLRFAAGASYRHDSLDFRPDQKLVTQDLVGFTYATPLSGDFTVWEGFGELLVPVLRDLPLIRELNLDLAYRYSDYNTSGVANTFKISGEWEPFQSVRFRGGFQRAIRSPSLGELFATPSQSGIAIGAPSSPGLGDPCDVRSLVPHRLECGASPAAVHRERRAPVGGRSYQYTSLLVFTTTGGNPNLKPEKANTYSAGLVLTPKFGTPLLSNFSASIDYYRIKLAGAVGTISTNAILPKCYNGDGSNPGYDASNVFCSFIQRDPNGALNNVVATSANLGSYDTAGIDIQADWYMDLDALGLGKTGSRLAFNTVVSYLDSFKIQNFVGAPTVDYAGSIGSVTGNTFPRWRALTGVTYSTPTFSLGAQWRYIGKMIDASRVTSPNSTAAGVPAVSYFDVNFQYKVTKNFELRGGVNNIFNRKPPAYASYVSGNTDPNTCDVLGTRFFIGAKARF